MKIEKINDNKVRIILTLDELEKREISLKEIEKDANSAKDFFVNLLEESNLDKEFEIDNSQLLIEATTDNNNLFVITITKINDLPELKKYSKLSKKNSSTNSIKNKKDIKKETVKNKITKYIVDSNIYSFSNMDSLLNFCDVSKNENLFFGRNSLYLYNSKYYIIFNKTSIKNSKFLKTFVFLSEYCDKYYNEDIFETTIKEKGKEIIKTNSIQKLNKVL